MSMSMTAEVMSNMLVNQSMGVGSEKVLPNTPLIDNEVLPAFGKQKEFQNILDQDVISLNSAPIRHGRFWKPKPVPRVTPGDGVLNTVQSVRIQFKRIQNHIEKIVENKNGANLSTKELLDFQYEVMNLAYLNDLSSKVADKTSQGAQTLFRNQG